MTSRLKVAVWSDPSGIMFTAEREAVHSQKWLSRNLSSSCIVLCLAQILSGVILEVLGEAFTEIITAEVALAWTKLLANMCCAVAAVYEEAGWTKLSPSAEWRSSVYRIGERFRGEMNWPNWPLGRMQSIIGAWGVKQWCIRGSFWDYATEFTEKEGEGKKSGLYFCQGGNVFGMERKKQNNKLNKIGHVSWMCLCMSRTCHYIGHAVHVNIIFSIKYQLVWYEEIFSYTFILYVFVFIVTHLCICRFQIKTWQERVCIISMCPFQMDPPALLVAHVSINLKYEGISC